MSIKEGSRDTGDGMLISIYPDVCLTPCGNSMVPVPYTLWAKQEDDANTTPTVRLTKLRSHNLGSIITTCHGDEAGTGGGVKSGTHNGICEPLEHSRTVRTEGKFAIRHTDIWWMNNRNTQGRLLYIKDPEGKKFTNASGEDWKNLANAAARAEPLPADAAQQLAGLDTSLADGVPQVTLAQSVAPFFRGPLGPLEEIPLIRPLPQLRPMPRLPMPRNTAPREPLLPKPGELEPKPQLGPQDQPQPQRGPTEDNHRTTGCRSETICFERGAYDKKEYERQLKMQEDAINAKSAAQNVKDIDHYNDLWPWQKPGWRALGNDNVIQAWKDWERGAGGDILRDQGDDAYEAARKGLAALHRLDIVAGGAPTDIAGLGDRSINSTVGSQWYNSGNQKQLLAYAKDMQEKGCPMAVHLDPDCTWVYPSEEA